MDGMNGPADLNNKEDKEDIYCSIDVQEKRQSLTSEKTQDVDTNQEVPDNRKNSVSNDMTYTLNEVPPWYLTLPLSIQQYLTMFGSTITAPYIIGPAICLPEDNPARAYILSTILFVSGIITLLQTTIGIRLPIIQGASAAFYTPMFALMSLPQWKCNTTVTANYTDDYDDEIWMSRMRELQGCIAVASVLPIVLSMTGAIHIMIRYITPLVVIPTISLIGLSLVDTGSDLCSGNWGIAIGTILVMLLCVLYLEKVPLPFPKYKPKSGCGVAWFEWFRFFPILTTLAFMWLLCYILTATEVFPPHNTGRTDVKSNLLSKADWFRFPYPFQWGIPTVSAAGVCGMLAAMVSTMIESIGDYYACARLSAAPNPPQHAISRGVLVEGVGCALAGMWGTGSGTVSYAENIGAISITKIASRRVIQVATIFMFIFGVITKFGALFVCIPDPVIGGMFMVMFGLIVAVGISNAKYIDMNSSRNLCIMGFAMFFGLSLPRWITNHEDAIDTGSETANEIIRVLLESSMLIGGVTGFILDNTVPGTPEERGLINWLQTSKSTEAREEISKAYDLPLGMSFFNRHKIFRYLPFCPPFQGFNVSCKSSTRRSSSIQMEDNAT